MSLGLVLLAGTGVAVAIGFNTRTSSASEADLFGFQAAVQPSPLSTLSTGVPYNLASGVCSLGSVPGPQSTQLPGYLDATTATAGPCTVSGSGTLIAAAFCSTGALGAQWQLGEPDGDTAEFDAEGVMVGGVAVLAAPPVAPLGYRDPASSSTAGAGAAVALLLPAGTDICPRSSFIGRLTAAVVGLQ